MTPRHWTPRLVGSAVVALTMLTGCGVLAAHRTDFAATAETADGNAIFRDQIDAIVENPNLTVDEKGEALRDLGIEDDDLVEALLTLAPPAAEPEA